MDVDSNPTGSHLLLELFCNHGAISELRGMKIFDVHDAKYRRELKICQRPVGPRGLRQEDISGSLPEEEGTGGSKPSLVI
jgi:hypothetical protein